MTDFKKPYSRKVNSPRKEKFFKQKKVHFLNENEGKISKELESDNLLRKHGEHVKQLRPEIKSKDPSTFCFYGSAQQYYKDSAYNIINYYPFDGTKEEIIDWHLSSSFLDTALLKQYWPKTVGHISLKYDGYVQFYSGPNKIDEFSTVSKYTNLDDPAIVIDPEKGNTIEFWLKKDGFNSAHTEKEIIADIGSYPGKVVASKSAQMKLYMTASSGAPFRLTYLTGLSGSSDIELGSSNVTTSSVADSQWHHYAVTVSHTGSVITAKLYVDGEYDSVTTSSAEDMFKVSTYLGGAIASSQSALSSSLSGSIDDFRFWKGVRNPKEIGRYFDKKVYASNTTSKEYTNRLGVYYKFNERPIDRNQIDRIAVDYSGNNVTGIIKNYNSDVRVMVSAITVSDATNTTEPGEPVINEEDTTLLALRSELDDIGKAYDVQNTNLLKNYLPHWATEEFKETISSENQFQTIMHMVAEEFDNIKQKIDLNRMLSAQHYEDPIQNPEVDNEDYSGVVTYEYATPLEQEPPRDNDNSLSSANRGWSSLYKLRDKNLYLEPPFLRAATLSERVDGHIDKELATRTIEECSQHMLQRIENKAISLLKAKGTARGIRAMYTYAAIDNTLVTDLTIPYNGNLFLEDSKIEMSVEKVKSVDFSRNNQATLHMSSSEDNEKTYIPSSSDHEEYTFEGTFIFPDSIPSQNFISESSLFGLAQVSASNNNLTITDPNNASVAVKAVKNSRTTKSAKFVLYSPAGLFDDIETEMINNVYANTRWNISFRIKKDSSESFVDMNSDKYSILFTGHEYLIDNQISSFNLSSSLSSSVHQNFVNANKTVFIGARRADVTGSVELQSDVKVLSLNGYSDLLSDEELVLRAKAPSLIGRNSVTFRNLSSTNDSQREDTIIFRTQFDTVDTLESVNPFTAKDASLSSVFLQDNLGEVNGSAYKFKSLGFTQNLGKVINLEYVEEARNVPIESAHSLDGIVIKENDIERFSLSTRPQTNIFSFEKSAYQAISREMIKFLSGIRSFNNLIGEPANKYRKNYKMLDAMKRKFFDGIKNENQFERFLNYYRWIDSAIGTFFEQVIPASAISNTGLENVVESHVLERNKYQHQFNNFEIVPPDLETNLLGINELLYDWEHGHFSDNEDEHCLWQRDRDERPEDRKDIHMALTTTIATGSNYNYVLRHLARPYKHAVDRTPVISLGHNRKANNIRDLHKIVNTGKTIQINSDDVYEFKKCDDILLPNQKKRYTAKTDTSGTEGYLDADADLILPFTMYSSSVGTDLEEFKSGITIANNLDYPESVQSPWVNTLRRNKTHRDNKVGTPKSDRIESYHISHTADTVTIEAADSSNSRIFGDLHASRLYHIANIKTTQSPLVIGNYSKDYEIVQTMGRSQNNNYLVENEGANLTGSYSASPYLTGTVDFYVPQRTKREHVFVNRFSSPGSAESMGPAGLDRAAAEYSVYNTLNYRNSMVRDTLNILHSERSERFGFRSGSSVQASVHKINRNFIRRTGSAGRIARPNNAFLYTQIPNNDFGYSWITASAIDTVYDFLDRNGNYGHQHNGIFSGSLKSSETILFVSKSDIGTGGYPISSTIHYGGEEEVYSGNFIPVDFVGLNTVILEDLEPSTNTLGQTYVARDLAAAFKNNYINSDISIGGGGIDPDNAYSDPATGLYGNTTTLNSIILNRQGPYGWPSWKQIRGSEHAVVRAHKKENTLSFSKRGRDYSVSPLMGYDFDYSKTFENTNTFRTPRTVENYKEILATSRFNAITVTRHRVNSAELDPFTYNPTQFNQNRARNLWFYDEYIYEMLSDIYTARGVLDVAPSISLRGSVANIVTGFANQEMARDIGFKEKDFKKVSNLSILADHLTIQDPSVDMLEMNYIETVYPKETNTYTKHARVREEFDFFGWDSTRSNRKLILSDNVSYSDFLVSNTSKKLFLHSSASSAETSFKRNFFNTYEIVDLNSTGSEASIASGSYITSSTWVLDSRSDFATTPVNLTASFFTDGDAFLSQRDQGTRGEGILQNDYSVFAMGYNGLRGSVPFAPIYNRRIPQTSGDDVYLAGEAKWEANQSQPIGPFYDDYRSFNEEIRLVGQEYSLIPEFTISKYIQDIYNQGDINNYSAPGDFLELTGAVYNVSSDEVSIGSQFLKTYSTSDFLKYFHDLEDFLEETNSPVAASKITMRCSAVKRFLPYRGLYPAERAVQITEIFHKNYLKEGSYSEQYIEDFYLTEQQSKDSLRLKIENTKTQVSKPLFMPGVLFNSIKSGLAVDYPIFSSSVSGASDHFSSQLNPEPITSFTDLDLGPETCFTGSIVNQTADSGIPRIKGDVSRRVTFEDLLAPERLIGETIYDNEPHPSASTMYGDRDFLKVMEHPCTFGSLDTRDTVLNNGIKFNSTTESFVNSMRPYRSAINNFASQTVKFFLKDEKIQHAISRASKPMLTKDVSYSMKVYVSNVDTVMYDRHSAFGPPVDDGGDTGVSLTSFSQTSTEAVPATGSITIDGLTYSDVNGTIISIPNVSGSTVNYEFLASGGSYATGDAKGSNTVIAINTTASAWDITVELHDQIEKDFVSASVSYFSFLDYNLTTQGGMVATQVGTINMIQETPGEIGNLTISSADSIWNTNDRLSSFQNGSNGTGPFFEATETTTSGTHGFLPYVPPFLDPGTRPYAEISFVPTETKAHTIPEIIEGMSVSYYNMPDPSNKSSNTNFKEAMVLSASIDFNNYILLLDDAVSYAAGGSSNPGQSDYARWVIRPKWETPVHDFKNVSVSAYNLKSDSVDTISGSTSAKVASPWKTRFQTSYYEKETNASETYLTASRGMWHQFGTSSSELSRQGYYLTIEGGKADSKGRGNLAEACGFVDLSSPRPTGPATYKLPSEALSIKLGQLADKKLVHEAVVAIPYYLTDDCKVKFLKMNPITYNLARDLNQRTRTAFVHSFVSSNSIEERERLREEYDRFYESTGVDSQENAAYQLRMMKKYILPPQFDFNHKTDLEPYVSYIFQFKAELDKEDLSSIWQNVYPKSETGIARAQHSKAISDWITTDTEFVTTVLIPERDPASPPKGSPSIYDDPEVFSKQEVRWLVFKAKYRAESDYEKVVQQSITDIEENVIGYSDSSLVGARDRNLRNRRRKDSSIFSKFSYNWPYDYFSMIEMIKLEGKVDFLSRFNAPPPPLESEIIAQRQTDGQQETTVFNYQRVDSQSGTSSSTASDLSNLVIRQVLKADTDAVPSPADTLTITVDSGYSVKSGSESIYVNGVLQAVGASNDYTISGATITFTFDLEAADSVVVTYIKEAT